MKFTVWLVAALLFGGCSLTSSTGLVKSYPSDQTPLVRCYIRAYEYLPPFAYYSDKAVPKRATVRIQLEDAKSAKLILNYEGKLKASPRNLDFGGNLRGNRFSVKVFDRDTRQSWTIEFQRQPDGRFALVPKL